jgi:hypothetical protein
MKASRKTPSSPIRMPTELKAWLKHRAIDNGRSLNSEVLARLQQSRVQEETENTTQK